MFTQQDLDQAVARARAEEQARVDQIVAGKIAEREQGFVVNELKKELDRIAREIRSANHLKQTFGRQLGEMARQLAELNSRVAAHMAMPMHAGTAEKFAELERSFDAAEAEFGLDNLTPEERASFPKVVKTVLAGQKRLSDQKQTDKENAESDSRHWQKIAAIATTVAVIVTILAAMGFFAWFKLHVFGIPS